MLFEVYHINYNSNSRSTLGDMDQDQNIGGCLTLKNKQLASLGNPTSVDLRGCNHM